MPRWPMLVRANQALQECSEDRRTRRAELLGRARDYTHRILGLPCGSSPAAGAIVASGHQAVWHHCGIWVKSLACSRLARALYGTGVLLVLDHDICRTEMMVPQSRPDGSWHCRRIPFEASVPNGPMECRRLEAAAFEQFIREVTEVDVDQFCNAPWRDCNVTRGARWDQFRSLADAVTYLQALLNVGLDLDNLLYLPVSQLCETRTFLMFVLSVFSNATCFAKYYNEAVAESSRDHRAMNKRGIRPLTIDPQRGQTELPFWLVRPKGDRVSLLIGQGIAGTASILTSSGEAGRLDAASTEGRMQQLKAVLGQHHWTLRPKAVALTLFVRLYLADWFIHGLGGVAYEPITDCLMRNYYGIKPLRYGVITCTAMLPRCRHARGPARSLSGLSHWLRHIKHNPELCLNESERRGDRPGRLIRAKRRQIMRAADRELPGRERKVAWKSIALINRQLRDYAGPKIRSLSQEMMQVQAERASYEVCTSREYFFGLFPRWRLHQLMEAMTFSPLSGTLNSLPPGAGGAIPGKENG